ncbi:MAG: hypothetical protein WA323_09220 [Candidatus Nitrosopolaris sp.]
MDQTKQIFGIILSLLILPTNAYAHTIEYEHGYKAALNDTLGRPTGFTSSLRFKACGAIYNTTQQMAAAFIKGTNTADSCLSCISSNSRLGMFGQLLLGMFGRLLLVRHFRFHSEEAIG